MTEKEVCTAILENAKCKPVFVDFTGGITDQAGADPEQVMKQVEAELQSE